MDLTPTSTAPDGAPAELGSALHDPDPEELDEVLAQARAVDEGLGGMSPMDRNDPIRLARALASEVVELIEEARASRPPPSRKVGI